MSDNENNNNDDKDEKDDAVPSCSQDEPPKKLLRLKSFASLMRKDEPEPLLRAPPPEVPSEGQSSNEEDTEGDETNPDENQSSYNWFVRPSCPLPPLSSTTYSVESFYTHDVEYDYWEEEFKPKFLQLESKFKVEPIDEEPQASSSTASDNRWGWNDPTQFGPHMQSLGEPHLHGQLIPESHMSPQLMHHMSSPYISEPHLASHLMAGPSHMGSQHMAGPSHLSDQLLTGPYHMGSHFLAGPSHMGSHFMAGPSHMTSQLMPDPLMTDSQMTDPLMTDSLIAEHMALAQSGHMTESQMMGPAEEDGGPTPTFFWAPS